MGCPEYLISAVIRYEKSATSWQMKHRIKTETHAKAKYKSLTKKSHKGMTYTDPGMIVFEDDPCLAVTLGLEINCACHGPGLVEMKCPATLIAKTPNVGNYKHIETCNDNIVLKMTSPYYSQIQGQLAVTKRSYCDLFIFLCMSNLTVCVDYKHSYWEKLLSNLKRFWKNVVAKELLTKKIEKKLDRIADENTLVAVSKPDINATIFDSVNNFHTDEILHTDFIDVSAGF